MYVLIDEGACVGCGSCEALCPDVFVMNDRGTAEAIAEATDANMADEMYSLGRRLIDLHKKAVFFELSPKSWTL